MKSKVLVLLALIPLGACAGALPWNPQGYTGINHAKAKFDPKTGKPLEVNVWGGKEQETVSLTFNPTTGEVNYSATGVKAFDGVKARAALEEAISDDVKEVFPEVVDAAIDGLTKAFGAP